ncbi:MAG: hypothetical protein IPJ65_12210 [Archangiaceae bacterium]|nr:hypothetical protein [Archangiaceae bacterium]
MLAVTLAAAPLRIAVGPVVYSDTPPERGEAYTEYLVQQLRAEGVRISSQREVMELLGAERQKQLLGCGDDGTACLAELIGALGSDGLLTGSLGQVSGRRVLSLKIISSSGDTIATTSAQADDEERLLATLPAAARALVHELAIAFPGRVELQKSSPRPFALAAGAVGLVTAGVGVALNLVARDQNRSLFANPGKVSDVPALEASISQIRTFELASWACIGAGAAVAVASLITFLVLGSGPVSASVALSPQGASFTVGVSL